MLTSSVQTGEYTICDVVKRQNNNNMAESVHSQITAVSWGLVSFTDNSLFGTSRAGHFYFYFWCVRACKSAWHACVWFFLASPRI